MTPGWTPSSENEENGWMGKKSPMATAMAIRTVRLRRQKDER
jgi:hypothetical protein